ncbi:hypothetical protein Francci3_2798 [Frankia casuarinae]|uniref:Uncharacterized protein n=1 Tax=Frankia casuarinae (strain DSM 45818 / CECT 9043 / HFP020203 / CcI3) TaxID=106370 RepID=Q2J986_FRACC|nr:hypothetical protein Francci3_2798 [Frankia casuarinae]
MLGDGVPAFSDPPTWSDRPGPIDLVRSGFGRIGPSPPRSRPPHGLTWRFVGQSRTATNERVHALAIQPNGIAHFLFICDPHRVTRKYRPPASWRSGAPRPGSGRDTVRLGGYTMSHLLANVIIEVVGTAVILLLTGLVRRWLGQPAARPA